MMGLIHDSSLVTCDTRDGNKRIVVLGKEVSIE